MSTPDVTETLSAPEPLGTAETTAPGPLRPRRRTARRRMGLRGRLLIAAGALVVLAIAVVTTLLVLAQLDHQNARAAADAARADARAASAQLRALQQQHDDAAARLAELLAVADAVCGISGTGIDPAATEALASARGAISAPAPATPSPEAPSGASEPESASTEQLRADATTQRAYAERLAAQSATERLATTTITADATSLGTALGDFATATAEVGSGVLTERSDADAATSAALQTAIDALTQSDPTGLADAVTSYRAAVDAVVASSEASRTPASGHIGTGIDDPTSLTVVVNKHRPLPANYAPSDLRTPAGVGNALPMRAVAASATERMAADMAAVGIQLRMSSAYRSYARQQTLYTQYVAKDGVAAADTYSARPGFSEHQTGLTADFDDGLGCNLNTCFQNTAGGRWLAENAWKYGFILRYGDGWQPIVGYRFEPWHYRYVGEQVAADMHARGINTLEEYFGLEAAPDYE